jgi:hypothetical protein
MSDSPEYIALLREGALAAHLLGSGVTDLRRVHTGNPGAFSSTLFSLSLGFERAGKLAFIVDHCIEKDTFPTDAQLRQLHHDINTLFRAVVEIAENRFRKNECPPVPNEPIHIAIIEALSEFAKATRYHNLDLLVGGKSASMLSPETTWAEKVGKEILKRHYIPEKRRSDAAFASSVTNALPGHSIIRVLGQRDQFMQSMAEVIMHEQQLEIIQRFAQFYTLQIIRFFAMTLGHLQSLVHGKTMEAIPYFSELFAVFYNDDTYFKRRKTWV